jgi:hypothetical protein
MENLTKATIRLAAQTARPDLTLAAIAILAAAGIAEILRTVFS